MPAPTLGLGEGANLTFGADGGPISSQDTFTNNFNTGAFSLRGETTSNSLVYLVAGAAITGVLLWALSLSTH